MEKQIQLMGTVIFYFSCNKGIKFKFRLGIAIMCNARLEKHIGGQSCVLWHL